MRYLKQAILSGAAVAVFLLCVAPGSAGPENGATLIYHWEDAWSPIVGSVILGGTLDGEWVDAEEIVPDDGELYRLYTLTGYLGETEGSGLIETELDIIITGNMIDLTPETEDASGNYFAISCDWDPLPRQPEILDTSDENFRNAIAGLLKKGEWGFDEIKIMDAVSVDLDGDGTAETIIRAVIPDPEFEYTGDFDWDHYSIAVLIQEEDDGSRLTPICGEWIGIAKDIDLAVMDVNGDGVMEIVEASSYYEHTESRIWFMEDGEIEPLTAASHGT